MQSKTILGRDGEPKAHEIKVELHGSGGKLGIKNIQILTKMIEDLKSRKTPEEVDQLYFIICGYYACCVNSGFINENDEFMELVTFLADTETERAERQQAGKGNE